MRVAITAATVIILRISVGFTLELMTALTAQIAQNQPTAAKSGTKYSIVFSSFVVTCSAVSLSNQTTLIIKISQRIRISRL